MFSNDFKNAIDSKILLSKYDFLKIPLKIEGSFFPSRNTHGTRCLLATILSALHILIHLTLTLLT